MSREPIKILFVCHGNICRSTMAQCVMQQMIDERGLAGRFLVDSAATTKEEIGMPINPKARKKLLAEGVPIVKHRARRMQSGEHHDWNYIICMDEENVRHLRLILGVENMGNVHKLLSYVGEQGDVADPWYTGNYDATYTDVVRGCTALLAQVLD